MTEPRPSSRPDSVPFSLPPAEPAVLYDRILRVGVERIWENVLDWEHLPHLHAQAFAGIRLLESSDEGWRALLELPGGAERRSEVDVVLDRARLRYTTATVSGIGEGTEIVTQLFPRSEHETEIRVEFFLPWLQPDATVKVAEAYRRLYQTLWDQDEGMMMRRRLVLESTRQNQVRSSQRLCLGTKAELAERLPLDVEVDGRALRIVLLDGELLAFDARCPHLGGPLGEGPVSGCEVQCPWHGYRFDLRTGRSCDGRGYRLAPAPALDVEADTGLVFVSAVSSGRG